MTLATDQAAGPAPERVVTGYLDHLTVERGLAANTIASYRRDLRRYTDYLTAAGVRDLREVAESDVSGFLSALRQGAGWGMWTTLRCRRPRPRGRWSPSAGCTGSPCSTAWCPTTWRTR
ncbi:site-specific integrase [Blastococcus sp. PRF04-17]|uniref:site-specific integrase n=1 Tax=Blastococcus sp. PRF04-17 TaxID=2933797 RepID=UPI001FF60F29|nr:site-specific integrase [Blastococcus sp. PRF04-17]UOY03969.1 site-specific integrase [Blastococcus sp. PRF04-17]